MRSVKDAKKSIDILAPTKQVPDVHSKAQSPNQHVIENKTTIKPCTKDLPSANLEIFLTF